MANIGTLRHADKSSGATEEVVLWEAILFQPRFQLLGDFIECRQAAALQRANIRDHGPAILDGKL
jgi:hypothetical protein